MNRLEELEGRLMRVTHYLEIFRESEQTIRCGAIYDVYKTNYDKLKMRINQEKQKRAGAQPKRIRKKIRKAILKSNEAIKLVQ